MVVLGATSPRFGALLRANALGTAVPSLLNLGSALLLARLLHAEGFGTYAVVTAAQTAIGLLTTQWIVQGLLRYLPGELSRRRIVELKAAAITSGAVSAAMTMLLAVVAWLFMRRVSTYQNFIAPVALYVALNSLFAPLVGMLHAQLHAGRWSTYRVIESALRLALTVALHRMHPTVASILWAAPLSLMILLPFLWRDAAVRVARPLHLRRMKLGMTIQHVARYGAPMTGWFLAAALLDISDRFILLHYRGTGDVGLYSAHYGLVAGFVAFACSPVLLSLHPLIMRAYDRGDEREARRLSVDAMRRVLLAGGALTLASVFAAERVSRAVLGDVFVAGHAIVPVVFAGLTLWQAAAYAHKPMEMQGRTGVLFMLAVGSALVNLALNFAFVPRYGIMAAAWSTTGSYAIYLAGSLIASSAAFTREPVPGTA